MSHVLLAGSYAPSLVNFRGHLIAALVKAGHKVSATAPDITPEIEKRLHQLGATPIALPLSRTGLDPLADLAYARALRRLIDRKKIDRLITYTIKPNIWGGFAARRAGIRSAAMVTGLGYAFADQSDASMRDRMVGSIARGLYRRAAKCHHHLVFQNGDDVADFDRAGCLPRGANVVMTAGSGVDLTAFRPSPLPHAPVFLMVARLLGAKGAREYAAAAAQVKALHPDWAFRLVGWRDEGPDGISADEIATWAALDYRGPSDDVAGEIAAASIYVLPSYREGTPRSSLEAMACGRPLITTDAPGCRETVRDGENGILVPVGDVDGLAKAMMQLGGDGELRARMGAAGRAFAEEHFDVDRVNEKLMEELDL